MKSLFKTIIFITLCISLGYAQPYVTRDSLIHHFNLMAKDVKKDFLAHDTSYNSAGMYSWGWSYLMNSYVMVYKATKDESYLKDFEEIADWILDHRDDRLGIKDWKGKTGPGWSGRRYWDRKLNKNVDGGPAWRDLINDGKISYPYLLFADVVLSNSALLKRHKKKANLYIREIETVMNAHIEEEWRDDTKEFIFPKGAPIWADGANVPLNYQTQAGSILLLLHKLTKKERYLTIAVDIAERLKRNLQVVDNVYEWHYWDGLGYNGWKAEDNVSLHTPIFSGQTNLEDIGHSGTDISFVLNCYQNKILFTRNDIEMFVRTFEKRLNRGTHIATNFHGDVDAFTSGSYLPGLFWFPLSDYDSEMYSTWYNLYYKKIHRVVFSYGNVFLLANLILYYP